MIKWNNIFDNITCNKVKKGIHITVPSVLQETKEWVSKNKSNVSFIDPEIGHMAYAAQKTGVEYSYLHVVSDNLAVKYPYDLSNERKAEVLLPLIPHQKNAEPVSSENPSLLTGSVFYSAIFYNSNFVLIVMILAGRNTVNKI